MIPIYEIIAYGIMGIFFISIVIIGGDVEIFMIINDN